MKSRKACWTCTARKVHCDGGLPSCQKCSRAGRKCQGYEIRLSWPKDGDKKRAIFAELPKTIDGPRETNSFFINTTWRDVEMHVRGASRTDVAAAPGSPSPLCNQPGLEISHMELIRYFHTTAYLSLMTYSVDPSQLRDIFLRIATKDNKAVLHALLAFSSLLLHGLTPQTIQFKISTLHFLSVSAKQDSLSLIEAVQHVAASMLLFSFDILTPSQNLGEWLWYLWGALNVIETTHLEINSKDKDEDISYLLDWFEYHNFMSRFSIYHSRYKEGGLMAPYIKYPKTKGGETRYESLMRYRPAIPSPNPTYFIHNLLSEIYMHMPVPLTPHSPFKSENLHSLINKISSMALSPLSTSFGKDDQLAREVYILSIKIYYLRACYLADLRALTSSYHQMQSSPLYHPPSNHSHNASSTQPSSHPGQANPQSQSQSQSQPESLLTLPYKIFTSSSSTSTPTRTLSPHACGHFFPSLILANEAAESQRSAILSLLDTVEKKEGIRGIKGLRTWIRGIWVKRDLRSEGEVVKCGYLGIEDGGLGDLVVRDEIGGNG